jgi:hypothetical protein
MCLYTVKIMSKRNRGWKLLDGFQILKFFSLVCTNQSPNKHNFPSLYFVRARMRINAISFLGRKYACRALYCLNRQLHETTILYFVALCCDLYRIVETICTNLKRSTTWRSCRVPVDNFGQTNISGSALQFRGGVLTALFCTTNWRSVLRNIVWTFNVTGI